MRADAGSLCTESCTDSWRHWLGSLCGQAARRILRSSCCATNSACCADRSTDPRSPTPTGACSGRSRPRYLDRAEPGGWSPPTRCCAGTAAASPGTGLNHSDRRAGHRPQRSFADSHCASQPRIQPGDIAASRANSPGSATASLRPRSGEILNNAGIDPAPTRSEVTWSQFLRSQAAVACDFTTIETVTLRRFYLLMCIDIATRTVYFAGVTDHPTYEDPQDTCTHSRGERVRRTLDRHPATRAPRPHHHLEPPPTQQACRRLHRSLQHAPAPPFARSATTRRHRPTRPAR